MSYNTLNQSEISGEFFNGFEGSPMTAAVEALCAITGSDTETKEYGFLDQAPAADRFTGTRRPKTPSGRKIVIRNEVYDTSMEFGIDDLRRDQTGDGMRKIGDLGKRLAQLRFVRVMNLINNGASSSVQSYDGKNYFAADHVVDKSGAQKNLLTASEVAALNVGSAAAPTPEEMVEAMLGTIGHMLTYLDDEGEPMNEDARRFMFMVPPNMWASSIAAMLANHLDSGETNVLAGLNISSDWDISVIQTPRLSGTTVMHCFRTDWGSNPPFILQEEVPVSFDLLDAASERGRLSRKVMAIGEWLGEAGPGQPLMATHCTFS